MSEVQCPYCGEMIRDLWDYEWGGDECIDIECPHCDEMLAITKHITYTARTLGDE